MLGRNKTKAAKTEDLEIHIEVVRQWLENTRIEISDDDYAKHLKLTAFDRDAIIQDECTGK